jgi:mitogen-activated protein kinase organizer 1
MTGSVDGHVRTYDLRKGELRSDFIGRTSPSILLRLPGTVLLRSCDLLDPVTAVTPTKDHQSYLVTTLDSHVRLMDSSTGKLLNDFKGHINISYRCRACFGFNEASIVCGDENGSVWAWDLVDVNIQVSLRMKDRSLTVDGIRRRSCSRTRRRGFTIR